MGHLDFSTIGSGTFVLFTFLSIAGIILGIIALVAAIALFGNKRYRWLAVALIPVGLVVGIGSLVPGAVNQLNGEQALQAAAKHTYGITLSTDQADSLLAFPKTIFNTQHPQEVRTDGGTTTLYGTTTIANGKQVRRVRLYETPNGTYHLATDNATLAELPKDA